MRKFKQVAPPAAPKTQPPPPAIPITKYQMISRVYSVQKDEMHAAIDAFKRSIEEDGCGFAMVWKGEPAFFAEAFLYETRGLEAFMEPKSDLDEASDLLRIREGFERMLGAAINSLLGGDFSSDDGPWLAKSTSAMTNIDLAQKSNVKRRLYKMYTTLLKCIDE